VYTWDLGDDGTPPRRLGQHAGGVVALAYSPDGGRLASMGRQDGQLRLWDAAGSLAHQMYRPRTLSALTISPDGRRVAAAGAQRTVTLWDVATGQESANLLGHTGWVWSLAFSPDGTRLASASEDQTVRLWDVESGQEILSLPGTGGARTRLAFSPDGRRLAVVESASTSTVRVWDTGPGG
jgi:WD40 repeat protein